MTFPILGGNGAVAGFSIDNSLRFNDGDSAHISRTTGGVGSGNRRTFTISTWLKRSSLGDDTIIGCGLSSDLLNINFAAGDELGLYNSNGGTFQTTRKFRDTSAWYHIVFAIDTTQATASNRVKIYVNGVQETAFNTETQPSQNLDMMMFVNSSFPVSIGKYPTASSNFFDGYLAQTCFIDGSQLSPTDFGEFDSDSGIWKPIDITELTFGTEGMLFDYSNSSDFGEDSSGNNNDATATNLGATDQTTDTPTNNFATLSFIDTHTTSPTLAEGNTDFTGVNGTVQTPARSTIAVSSGKWYMEYKYKTADGGVGVMTTQSPINDHLRDDSDVRSLWRGSSGGYYYGRNNSGAIDGAGDNSQTFSADDIGMIALDLDNGNVYFGKNGTWLNGQDGSTTGVPTSGSSGTGSANHPTQLLTNQHDGVWTFMAFDRTQNSTGRVICNFGNPPYTPASAVSDAKGHGKFEYAPPSGYLALCTQNLATTLSPTIDDGSQYFNTVLYSGTGSENAITGVGFQPDWTWLKGRSIAYSHRLYDSNRGATKRIFSNNTDAESTQAEGLKSFDSDGFTLGTANGTNQSSHTFVSFNWKANGGTTSSNTNGSITSTVQANTTAGFSIVTWTGSGSSNETVGHGLSSAPTFVILKPRSEARHWLIWSNEFGDNDKALLFNTDTLGDNRFGPNAPTSSVFGLYGGQGNRDGTTFVAYCFHDVEGYSKFGSYTGNGSSDGVFVYTGFKPAWVMFKRTSQTESWVIADNKRDTDNPVGNFLLADTSGAEASGVVYDFLSNGIKLRDASQNESGATYIYMCFAENPFVSSSGVPVTAR